MGLEVREHESYHRPAGGVAVGGLVTGIAGSALSLLTILKETFGSKGVTPSNDMLSAAVTALAPALGGAICGNGGSNRLNEAQAEIAKLMAEKYTDRIAAEVYRAAAAERDKVSANFKEVYQEEVALRERTAALELGVAKDKEIAKLEAQLMEARLNGRVDKLEAETRMGFQQVTADLAMESERRCHGDHDIREWAHCTFVPFKKVIDSTQLCPPVELSAGYASNVQPVYQVNTSTTTTA